MRPIPAPEVLVIDDDAQMRGYLQMALAALPCTVRCIDGAEFHPLTPQVALVDLLLADTDGLDWIARLVAAGTHVICISGLAADAPLVEQARAAGAHAVLPKPFSLSALRDAVRLGLRQP